MEPSWRSRRPFSSGSFDDSRLFLCSDHIQEPLFLDLDLGPYNSVPSNGVSRITPLGFMSEPIFDFAPPTSSASSSAELCPFCSGVNLSNYVFCFGCGQPRPPPVRGLMMGGAAFEPRHNGDLFRREGSNDHQNASVFGSSLLSSAVAASAQQPLSMGPPLGAALDANGLVRGAATVTPGASGNVNVTGPTSASAAAAAPAANGAVAPVAEGGKKQRQRKKKQQAQAEKEEAAKKGVLVGTQPTASVASSAATLAPGSGGGPTVIKKALNGKHEGEGSAAVASASAPTGSSAQLEAKLIVASRHGNLEQVKALVETGVQVDCTDHSGSTPLALACGSGYLNVAQYLVDRGANVNHLDKTQNSVFSWAASKGHQACAWLVYARGADPNSVDAKQRSALHYCVFKNNPEMVRFLVGLENINLNLINSFGETPLDLCKSIPDSKEVETILRNAGAKWGSSIVKKDVVDAAEGGFILAARLGRLDFVHKALQKNKSLALSTDRSGKSALSWAAGNGFSKICLELLAAGADVNSVDKTNSSCLSWAAFNGHVETVQILIEHGANVNLCDAKHNTVLHYAARAGGKVLEYLLTVKGLEKNVANIFGETPLDLVKDADTKRLMKESMAHGSNGSAGSLVAPLTVPFASAASANSALVAAASVSGSSSSTAAVSAASLMAAKPVAKEDTGIIAAVRGNNLPLLKKLLASGVSADTRDAAKNTILQIAASSGNLEAVNELLAAKANPNLVDANNASSLSWAALRGQLEICKALVAAGALVTAQDKDLNSPFSWSCGNGHAHVAEFLLKSGANPNTADKHRNTPFHWACQNGHANVVKFLLSTKANINALNMYNYSPLDYANDRKNMDILQMLKKAGAKSGTKMAAPTGLPKKRDFIIK